MKLADRRKHPKNNQGAEMIMLNRSHSFRLHGKQVSHQSPPPYSNALILLRYGLIRGRDSGSSLVFALIFVFVVLATSLMVSNRGMLGMVGSFFNQDSKLARDAADIGILRTVMLLNEPKNRQLLINADDLHTKSGSQLADVTTSPAYQNPCETESPNVTNATMGIKTSDSNIYPTIEIDDATATNGIRRQFTIQKIQQQGIADLNTGAAGGILIEVRGQAIDKNGKILSSSVITRELEVVPKCCGLSLGGPSQVFGADNRKCDNSNPGLGLIAGTYFRNNGKFNTTGRGITFTTPDPDGPAGPEKAAAINNVFCLDASSTNDCADGGITSRTDTNLVEVNPKLNDVPAMPAMPGGTTSCDKGTLSAPKAIPLTCDLIIDDNLTLSTADFASWGSGTAAVPVFTTSISTSIVTSETTTTSLVPNVQPCQGRNSPVNGCQVGKNFTTTPSLTQTLTTTIKTTITNTVTITSATTVATTSMLGGLKEHCFQRLEAGTTVTYCSLNSLSLKNSNHSLNIDTSGGPIRFYFPNPNSGVTLGASNGTGAIYQSNASGSTKYSDLSFFGIPRAELDAKCPSSIYTSSCQNVYFGAGTPRTSTFFAYFPGGNSTFLGNASMEGVLWSNIINATGSTDFVTSSSGIGDVLSLIGMSSGGSGGSGGLYLFSEYVTRFTNKFSFFSG